MRSAVCLVCLFATYSVASAYRVVSVDEAGRVSGRVRLEGPAPAAGFLPVLKNADVCGERVPDESLVVAADGGVRGVVVELLGVSSGKPLLEATAVLDNQRCAFVPRVQVLAIGQSLEIRNSDPILHDAHAWLGSRTIFNLGLPEWRRVEHVFEVPGMHAVDCNVLHTWMKAWIFVAEHPYVTVTDPGGRFVLDDVPAGTYHLRFWHEELGEKTVPVSVTADGEAVVDTAFRR